MKRDYKLFVQDILDAIKRIEEFVGEMSFEEFIADAKTASATVLQVQIIGEATKNIPAKLRNRYAGIPWKDMAAMRDKVTHFYFGVDYKIVWRVIKKDLPVIRPQIERILAEL